MRGTILLVVSYSSVLVFVLGAGLLDMSKSIRNLTKMITMLLSLDIITSKADVFSAMHHLALALPEHPKMQRLIRMALKFSSTELDYLKVREAMRTVEGGGRETETRNELYGDWLMGWQRIHNS